MKPTRAGLVGLVLSAGSIMAFACGRLEVGLPGGASGESIGGSEAGAASAPGGRSPGAGGVPGDPAGPTCAEPLDDWQGCVSGQPCMVCAEPLGSYALYRYRHPRCTLRKDCPGSGETSWCSSDCPPPTERDQCMGSPGSWSGCRGTGCSPCSELLVDYPNYFTNHRACARNDTCAGLYYPCNTACPEPGDIDR